MGEHLQKQLGNTVPFAPIGSVGRTHPCHCSTFSLLTLDSKHQGVTQGFVPATFHLTPHPHYRCWV